MILSVGGGLALNVFAAIYPGSAWASELADTGGMSAFGDMSAFGGSDNDDLNNFIRSFVIKDGATVVYDSTNLSAPLPTLETGKNYIIVITFAEIGSDLGDLNNSGILHYTLPSGVKLLHDIAEQPIILENNVEVGSYIANASNGEFTVTFENVDNEGNHISVNFVELYADVIFKLEMDAEFVAGDDGASIVIDVGGGFLIAFPSKPAPPKPAEIVVDKNADITTTPGFIDYTIKITASGSPVTGIQLTDVPFVNYDGSLIGNLPSSTQLAAYTTLSYTINGAGTPTTMGSMANITSPYPFTGVTLNPGEFIEVTYSLNIDAFIAASGFTQLVDAYYVGNNVTVAATDVQTVTDHTLTPLVTKAVSKDYAKTTANQWTATVGNGTEKLNGRTITDTMTGTTAHPMRFPSDRSQIFVDFYNTTDFTSLSYTFTVEYLLALTPSPIGITTSGNTGDILTFTVPATGVSTGLLSPATFGDIYRVVFRYDTDEVVLSYPTGGTKPSDVKHTNRIEFDNLYDTDTRTFTATEGGDVPGGLTGVNINHKKSSHPKLNNGVYEIEYEIEIVVPAGNETNMFYLYDELSFYERTTDANGSPIPVAGITLPQVTFFDSTDTEIFPVYKCFPSTVNENRWNIYFASKANPTGVATTSADSQWQLDEYTKIVITYTIPLDLEPNSITYNPDDLTIEELLKKYQYSYVYNNLVIVCPLGGGSSMVTRDGWPIHKKGEPTDDPAVFDYTVTLNGSYRSGVYDGRYQLFNIGEAASFTDEFDSRLEYVDGSFYATVTAPSITARYNTPPGSPTVAPGTPPGTSKLTINLFSLRSAASDSLPLERHDRTIVLHYQLRVKNPANLSDEESLDNDASITSTMLNSDFSNDATVTFEHESELTKSMEYASKIAKVTIDVNPNGWKLANGDLFHAVDTMSKNLGFYYNTITVKVGGADQPLTQDVDAADTTIPWSPGKDVEYAWRKLANTVDGKPRIEFIFPDETPIQIVYDAMIIASIGETIAVENKIEIFGTDYSASDGKNDYLVDGTGGSASGYRSYLDLEKEDSVSGSPLGGAKFNLYMALLNDAYYGGVTIPTDVKHLDIGGAKFYSVMDANGDVMEVETDPDTGKASFDTPRLTTSYNAVFLLVETAAPSGYVLPDEPYTFFVLGGGGMTEDMMNKWKEKLPDITIMENIADSIVVLNDPPTPPGPTDPTDPPTDPTDPPTDPTDPTNPTTPTNPTVPTEPVGPTQPTDPTGPTGPTDPTSPPTPTYPDSVGPTQPTLSTQPPSSGTPRPPVDPPPSPPRDPEAPEPSIDPPLPDPQPEPVPEPLPEPAPEQQQVPEPEQQEQPSDSTYIPGGNNFNAPPNPTVEGHTLEADGDGWIEFDDAGVPLGRWDWIDPPGEWVFTDLDIPLGNMVIPEETPIDGTPNTGDTTNLPILYVLLVTSFIGMVLIATWQIKVKRTKRSKRS